MNTKPSIRYDAYPGRILYVDGAEVWRINGRRLWVSRDGGENWKTRAVLPMRGISECMAINRITRRLSRTGGHHFQKTGEDCGVMIAHKHIFELQNGNLRLRRSERIQGSRPLTFCRHNDALYYGEYRGNPERSAVHVWKGDLSGSNWEPVWKTNQVRHIHGVMSDPYTNEVWVTTGDKDAESTIQKTSDDFKTLELVSGGSQTRRAVQLLFDKGFVYYGSDAPDEPNYIYRLDRKTGKPVALQKVGGPVFYGCKSGDFIFFSTVCEPSEINNTQSVELWGSSDGENWKCITTFQKDRWNMKLFQYGQLLFPAGKGDDRNLWLTPFATRMDQQVLRISLDEIKKSGL